MPREHCHVCEGEVEGVGPWCDLYTRERQQLCRPLVSYMIEEEERIGDWEMAGKLIEYWNRLWPDSPMGVS